MTTPAESDKATVRTRRRWYQLGLRSLLLMVTLIAVALAWTLAYVRPYLRQADIRERILAIGGKCDSRPGPGLAGWLGGVVVSRVDLSQIREGYSRLTPDFLASRGGLLYQDGHAARDADYLPLLRDLGDLPQLVNLNVSGQDITDDIVASWQDLTALRTLDLSRTLVQDASTWPEMEGLQRLEVNETPMEGAGLAPIGRYRGLIVLKANQTGCDDATIASWSDLNELTFLSIAETRVTLASREALQALPKLNTLEFLGERSLSPMFSSYWYDGFSVVQSSPQSLPAADVTTSKILARLKYESYRLEAAGLTLPRGLQLRELGRLPDRVTEEYGDEIRWLLMDSRYVDDDVLSHLDKVPELSRLDLSNSWITDDGLKQLAKCPKLEHLILRNTRITDAGLASLSACPKLLSLDLAGTRITHRGLPQLVALCQQTELYQVRIPQGMLRGEELSSLKDLPFHLTAAEIFRLQSAQQAGGFQNPGSEESTDAPGARKRTEILVDNPGIWDLDSRRSAPLTAEDVQRILELPDDLVFSRGAIQAGGHPSYFGSAGLPLTRNELLKFLYLSPEAVQSLPPSARATLEASNR